LTHQHHPAPWEQAKGWSFLQLSAKLKVHDQNATDLGGQIKLPIRKQVLAQTQLTSTS